jgi:hypothetical protein
MHIILLGVILRRFIGCLGYYNEQRHICQTRTYRTQQHTYSSTEGLSIGKIAYEVGITHLPADSNLGCHSHSALRCQDIST